VGPLYYLDRSGACSLASTEATNSLREQYFSFPSELPPARFVALQLTMR